MSTILTIVIGVLLLVLGTIGIFRGVRAGLLTLLGTLIAAALVDLWQQTLTEWVRGWIHPEHPETWVWGVVMVCFLGVALLVGYGGNSLIPRHLHLDEAPPGITEFLSGALLGVLNGALIASYLIRYTQEILQSEAFQRAVQSSVPARLLSTWLPWFVLAIVLAVLVNILLRIVQGIFHSSQRRARYEEENSIAGAGTEEDKYKAIDNKISQRLGD